MGHLGSDLSFSFIKKQIDRVPSLLIALCAHEIVVFGPKKNLLVRAVPNDMQKEQSHPLRQFGRREPIRRAASTRAPR